MIKSREDYNLPENRERGTYNRDLLLDSIQNSDGGSGWDIYVKIKNFGVFIAQQGGELSVHEKEVLQRVCAREIKKIKDKKKEHPSLGYLTTEREYFEGMLREIQGGNWVEKLRNEEEEKVSRRSMEVFSQFVQATGAGHDNHLDDSDNPDNSGRTMESAISALKEMRRGEAGHDDEKDEE